VGRVCERAMTPRRSAQEEAHTNADTGTRGPWGYDARQSGRERASRWKHPGRTGFGGGTRIEAVQQRAHRRRRRADHDITPGTPVPCRFVAKEGRLGIDARQGYSSRSPRRGCGTTDGPSRADVMGAGGSLGNPRRGPHHMDRKDIRPSQRSGGARPRPTFRFDGAHVRTCGRADVRTCGRAHAGPLGRMERERGAHTAQPWTHSMASLANCVPIALAAADWRTPGEGDYVFPLRTDGLHGALSKARPALRTVLGRLSHPRRSYADGRGT
jgi:hypothetical protein